MHRQQVAYHRGEVWWADLSPVRGHEQAGRRPVLIVSDDRFNRGSAGTVMIVPLTRTLRGWATRLGVDPPNGGVTARSEIMCDQLRAVTVERLEQLAGAVDDATLDQVSVILRLLLAI